MSSEDRLLRNIIIEQERKLKPQYPRTAGELTNFYSPPRPNANGSEESVMREAHYGCPCGMIYRSIHCL